jgi:hypothetical protein
MTMEDRAFVDANFIGMLSDGGNDFMLKAAVHQPRAFQACIDGGWAKINRGHWFEKAFFGHLSRIKDPTLAAHVLGQVLKDASPDEVNAAILGKHQSDAVAARRWFQFNTVTPQWRHQVLRRAMDLGLDLSTEFAHTTNRIASTKYTLASSFIVDASGLLSRVNVHELFEEHASPLVELMDLGATLDKNALACILKHHTAEVVPFWLGLYEQRGLLNATEALQAVSRLKIPEANLAHLQAKAAFEAVEASMTSLSSKSMGGLF